MSKLPERKIWSAMIARCHSRSDKDYGLYGKRGIKVCKRWRESFDSFLSDMGTRPSAAHTLDREDNSEGYHPLNCRWVTVAKQAQNRRTTVLCPLSAVLIRCMSRRGWSQRNLAAKFGVARNTVQGVLYYSSWSNAIDDLSSPQLTKGEAQQGC